MEVAMVAQNPLNLPDKPDIVLNNNSNSFPNSEQIPTPELALLAKLEEANR